MQVAAYRKAQYMSESQYFATQWQEIVEAFAHFSVLKTNYKMICWLPSIESISNLSNNTNEQWRVTLRTALVKESSFV